MTYILLTYALVVTILAKYFYEKWKENEHLFELSKSYNSQDYLSNIEWIPIEKVDSKYHLHIGKLNKDGTPRKPRSDKGKKRNKRSKQ